MYSPSQSTDTDKDRMEFVVKEEAEEDDGTRVKQTPQIHSVNKVAARAQALDVQIVVPNTTVENTLIQIFESPEAQRTTIDVSRQEDGILQPESIMRKKKWQRTAPDTMDPLLDNSQVGAKQAVNLTTKGYTSVPTV